MRQNPMMALTVAADDELLGTRLVLHHPRPAEVALRFDRPWEGAFCAYVTVLHDGDI